jgi:F-type H+-transporting ATPase subunit delta
VSDTGSGAGVPAASIDPIVKAYAGAIIGVATAEGALDRVEDELFGFARAMEGNATLRDRLVDPSVDVVTKLGVVGDLLGGRAHPQTVSAIGFVVQSGRARQLPQVADAVMTLAAQSREHAFAVVRSAVPLDDAQRKRLAQALARTVGHEVDVKVVVDPSVVGGVVVKVGDTVIDGSVARRLGRMRAQLTGAE